MAETLIAVQEHEERGTRTAGALNRSLSNASLGVDEFNWDEAAGYNKADRERFAKQYESTLTKVNEQQIVKGTVVSLDDREVVVNIGFKSEGIIPITEFRDTPNLKPGDPVEVYLETIENKAGHMVLSRKTANSMRSWEKINSALDQDLVVEGVVKRRTKGGFVVDVEGVEAFLPGSQIDVKPVRDYDSYVGRRMEFKVVKINHQQHNVVISHKALIEKDIEAQKAEIIGNLIKGQVLEGTVKNITSFGVFIDLGGVDGLLHITDISWGRISSPDEVLKLDQKLNVVVLDFDDEKRRISLGLKQLQPHPWENLPATVQIGSKVKGRIVTIADYGVFVEVVPGVEGLVHVSEMSWSQHSKNPSDLFSVGQEIDAVVLTIDTEEKKMSLGMKQLSEDPWHYVQSKYPLNSRHTGIVRNITNFGLFVELEEGVDGLVHIQDLSWSKKINHPSEVVKRDDKLEVVVVELDVENRKLRLGHKQLTEDPWTTFENVFPEGSVHTGTITRLTDKGAAVELPYGIEGFAPIKQLTPDAGKEKFKEGDTAEFSVSEFNKEQRKIVLSHSRTWQVTVDEAKPKAPKAKAKKESTGTAKDAEKDTLGDHSALAGLKAKMDSNDSN
jgi:small subunit ribosomal protein S1